MMKELMQALGTTLAAAALRIQWEVLVGSIVVYVLTRHVITPIVSALTQFIRARAERAHELAAMATVVKRELVDGGEGTVKGDLVAIRRKQDDEIVRHDNDMADTWSAFSRLGIDRRETR